MHDYLEQGPIEGARMQMQDFMRSCLDGKFHLFMAREIRDMEMRHGKHPDLDEINEMVRTMILAWKGMTDGEPPLEPLTVDNAQARYERSRKMADAKASTQSYWEDFVGQVVNSLLSAETGEQVVRW